MIEAGIYEGDLVIVDGKMTARPGDIVVALIDGENTVKRLKKNQKGTLYLKPENKEYLDIYAEKELVVQGVVTGLIRSYVDSV